MATVESSSLLLFSPSGAQRGGSRWTKRSLDPGDGGRGRDLEMAGDNGQGRGPKGSIPRGDDKGALSAASWGVKGGPPFLSLLHRLSPERRLRVCGRGGPPGCCCLVRGGPRSAALAMHHLLGGSLLALGGGRGWRICGCALACLGLQLWAAAPGQRRRAGDEGERQSSGRLIRNPRASPGQIKGLDVTSGHQLTR